VLEKFFHWRHTHDAHQCEGPDCPVVVAPLGKLILVSDGAHNFIDGIIIGASFLVSVPVGIATTLAVILHEIPQELGDYGILIHAGYKRGKALLYNFFSGLFAVVGLLTVYILGARTNFAVSIFLAIGVGGFLYIAGSDLVPELHKKTKISETIGQFIALVLGVFVMIILAVIE